MFMNLDADVAHRLEATTMASFLEIYGEDVYDLLSDGHAPETKRASLQARAGGGGDTFVVAFLRVDLAWRVHYAVGGRGPRASEDVSDLKT